MLSNFFDIPLYLVIPIFQAVVTVMGMFFDIFSLFVNSIWYRGIGFFFLIPVSISFIFVAIKFIRSFVWGS